MENRTGFWRSFFEADQVKARGELSGRTRAFWWAVAGLRIEAA